MFRNSLFSARVWLILACGPWANQAFGQNAECATLSTTASDVEDQLVTCPRKGSCDVPDNRNQYVPASLGSEVHMRVRVNLNYFSHGLDDEIAAQSNKIYEDFLAHHIELVVVPQYRNHEAYVTINTLSELAEMRTAYHDPTKLNVYVADMDVLSGALGKAVLPWDAGALTDQGGVLVHDGAADADDTTMTHEIGHALGLWHTHHGAEIGEMHDVHGTCSGGVCHCQCYESPDCYSSSSCNYVGDFCSDTAPTPGNFVCEDPGGEDPCSQENTEWGETGYHNFMGYAEDSGSPPFCRNQFTTQQGQRMHCWACNKLKAWIDSLDCNCTYLPDICDISTGESEDEDENGIPDECQSSPPPYPVKACCFEDESCAETTECHCDQLGGNFLSGYASCGTAPCMMMGPQP